MPYARPQNVAMSGPMDTVRPHLAVEHELLDVFLDPGELLHGDRWIIRPRGPRR